MIDPWPGAGMGELPAAVLAAHLDFLRMEGRAASTRRSREQALARVGRALPCPLLEATPEHLLAWRVRLATGGHAVRAEVSHLSQFYTWAARRGLVTGNPAAGLPVPPRGRTVPRPISEDDLMLALASAPDRIRLWIVLAAWCGLRAKEIALLRRENILLAAQPEPLLLVASDATKGIRERLVPLAPFVTEEIAAAGLPARGWSFLRHDGQSGPNTPARISHLASRHFHDCGIAATLHMCRHRFATVIYGLTKDLRLVQDLLGHASIASTQIYADWHRPDAAAAVLALPVPPRLHVVGGDAG